MIQKFIFAAIVLLIVFLVARYFVAPIYRGLRTTEKKIEEDVEEVDEDLKK